MSFNNITHPFSKAGSYDFLYDLYIDGKIPKCFSNITSSTPSDLDINEQKSVNFTGDSTNIWLVKNVPGYLDSSLNADHSDWRVRRVRNYKGYAIRLSDFDSPEALIKSHFNSHNRKRLRSKLRKLEQTGNLSYEFYYGDLSWKKHLQNFEQFYVMLKDRFDQLRVYNRNLSHWKFFCRNSFERIKEKKAFLLVLRRNSRPIAFSLNYLWGKFAFSIFKSHDSKFAKYNLADICILKKLEWCYAQGILFHDFSYGQNYHKEKWSNYQYYMYHYIFYNNNLEGIIKASFLELSLKMRQKLRDWGILGKLFDYNKLRYRKEAKRLKVYPWKEGLVDV
jgi:hypothetical protein